MNRMTPSVDLGPRAERIDSAASFLMACGVTMKHLVILRSVRSAESVKVLPIACYICMNTSAALPLPLA